MKVVSTLVEAHIFRKKNNDIEFLLLKRSEDDRLYPGLWQMVTGSIEDGEKAFETALREIKEEIGLLPQQFWVVPNVNSFYSPEKDEINLISVFAALIDAESNVKISYEHSEYKWIGFSEAKKMLAWKGQRQSVDTIYSYFTNELSTFNLLEIKISGSKK